MIVTDKDRAEAWKEFACSLALIVRLRTHGDLGVDVNDQAEAAMQRHFDAAARLAELGEELPS